ncbi:MAG: hypothetical protein ACUVQ1_03305 [Candidatus Kapaibacteriales bacterium]
MIANKIYARIKGLLSGDYWYFKTIILIQSLFFTAILLFIVFKRINYPFELEWMEGSTVEHIIRLVEGKKIYTNPTLEFIPHIYTPFFNYIGFIFSKLFGIGFFPLRLISSISYLGTCYVIYRIVFDETKSHLWAIVGISIYSGSYGISGFWYDLARVDSLANFFTILSFFFLIKDKNTHLILSIFFAFLAFYTKQSQLIIILLTTLPLFVISIKKYLIYLISLLGLIIISILIENFISNGWFFFWNFTLPQNHYWEWNRAITFWTIDILPFYSISLLLIFFFISIKTKWNEQRSSFYTLFFISSLINSYILRLHYGGYNNVFIPLIISLSILLPIACYYYQKIYFANKLFGKFIYLAIVVQFILLIYKPERAIPKHEAITAGLNFIEFLKKADGEVFIPAHSYISRLAGKKSYTHFVLMNDLFISSLQEKNSLYFEWKEALKNGKFSLIIMENHIYLPLIDEYYFQFRDLSLDSTFITLTGYTRPTKIYMPKKNKFIQ